MTFSAIYQGKCYMKCGGRKFHKKGIRLADIKDSKGNLILKQIDTKISKTFSDCSDLVLGSEIDFEAVLTDKKKLLYISNVKVKN